MGGEGWRGDGRNAITVFTLAIQMLIRLTNVYPGIRAVRTNERQPPTKTERQGHKGEKVEGRTAIWNQ